MLIVFRMFKLVSILFFGWFTDKVGTDQIVDCFDFCPFRDLTTTFNTIVLSH